MYQRPTVQEFKDYFFRDFPYGATPDFVMDQDIAKAIEEADYDLNEGVFPDQQTFTLAFLYLIAHFLVTDLRNSSQGLSGRTQFIESSKSVGSVSQAFTIPSWATDSPYWTMLATTSYGGKYMQLVQPFFVGNIMWVCGSTKP